MNLLSNLINGISLGSVYAIIALGYTMVYGIAKMLNFAHGDVIMVGAYVCFCTMSYLNLPPVVGVILAVVVCTLLGIVIERLAYKPLRSAPSLAVLITAIGVSYFLQNAALLIWKSDPKVFTSVINLPSLELAGGDLLISSVAIVTVLACIIIMVALTLFTGKTKMGKAMRAVSEDKGAAQLMGINVNSTISLTFAIGSGLAAIAGVLAVLRLPHADAHHRLHARYQGIYRGSSGRHRLHPRRYAGRYPAGRHRDLQQGVYLHWQLSDAIVFAVLIVVLLIKPAGLLGKTGQRESVRWRL